MLILEDVTYKEKINNMQNEQKKEQRLFINSLEDIKDRTQDIMKNLDDNNFTTVNNALSNVN
jgi:hypothetical protein